MNTYDENLRECVGRTLDVLAREDAALGHGVRLARATLYHAGGAVLAARESRDHDTAGAALRKRVHRALDRARRHADALSAPLARAAQGGEAAIGNAATVAANLEAGGDAAMRLASTVGAALNVAAAALHGSELHRQLVELNDHLNRIANQARYLALLGMEASGRCAATLGGDPVAQGKDVLDRLTALTAQAAADLQQSEQAVQADQGRIGDAVAAEFAAREALAEVAARRRVMRAELERVARRTNFGLQVEVLSSRRIRLSFSAAKPSGDFPAPRLQVHAAVVPQGMADQFTEEQAAQAFGKWDGRGGAFTPVEPGDTVITLTEDAFGNAVRPGGAYRAFLHLRPHEEYKRHLGVYADLLSAASLPFVPCTELPAARRVADPSDDPRRLLLAVVDLGQDGAGGVERLAEARRALEADLEWLLAEGASLAPQAALDLDAVLPPFAACLDRALAALEARDHAAAAAAEAEGRELLNLPGGREASGDERVAALRARMEAAGRALVSACAPRPADAGTGPELRCILLDQALGAAAEQAFTLDLAEQVTPANYIVARRLPEPPDSSEDPDEAPRLWYAVDIGPDDSDSYGNPLVPGHRYAPAILAVAPEGGSAVWANSLTILDTPWHCA